MVSVGHNSKRLFFCLLLFTFNIDAPLSEIILSGWCSGEATEAALSDDEDQTDDPEAENLLTILLKGGSSGNGGHAIDFFVL